MRDLEVAKTTLPISIWEVLYGKGPGDLDIHSHTGNPHFRIEFVSIFWGLTYIIIILSGVDALLDRHLISILGVRSPPPYYPAPAARKVLLE